MSSEPKHPKSQNQAECLGCGVVIFEPIQKNKMGDEFICDKCREEMLDSLEGAWIKHSAFLDPLFN